MQLGWIGTHADTLSVRVDEPRDRRASAAVVFVPTIGREGVVSSRAQKAFGIRAAEMGFLGVSFSFSGDGDSCSALPDDVVAAWTSDIERVVAATRVMLPDRPVHAVGLRLGAALLSQIQLRPGERRILWEPTGGAAFLNRHLALRRIGVRLPAHESYVELSGFVLTPRQAESLRRLKVAPCDAFMTVRKEEDRETAARIASVTTHAAQIPAKSIDEMLATLPHADSAIPPSIGAAIHPTSDDLKAGIRESHVQVGPLRLAGILAEPLRVPHRGSLLFTAMGAELKCGPGNLWAESSRSFAGKGVVCLRVDRTELGDSINPAHPGEPRPYRSQAVEDLVNAAKYIKGRTSEPLAAVGVCAAGWLFMKAASMGAPIDHVVCVNNIHWNPDAEAYDEAFYEHFYHEQAHQAQEDESVPVEQSDKGSEGGLHVAQRIRGAASDAKHKLAIRMPRLRAWVRGDKSLALERPGPMLHAIPQTTSMTMVMGPWEYSRFAAQGGLHDIARLTSKGRNITAIREERIDHSVLSLTGQDTVVTYLQRALGLD